MSKAVAGVSGSVNGFSQLGTGRADSLMAVADSFSSIMQKTTGQDNSKMENTDFQPADSKKTDVQDSANVMKENSKTAEKIEKSTQTEKPQADEETLNAAEDAVKETAEKVVKEVADTLGISEEEVEQAMETLGLTAVSLLDNTNLTQLMMNLSGETDLLALTTNEGLYTGIKDIMQMIQKEMMSIQEMYGLTEEQLNECVDVLTEEAQQMFTELEGVEAPIVVDEMATEDVEDVNTSSKAIIENDANNVTTATTQETAQLADTNENATENN